MKLSDLIAQKLTIDSWDVKPELLALDKKLSLLRDNIDELHEGGLAVDAALIEDDIHAAVHDLMTLSEHIVEIKASAGELMQELSRAPMSESYDMYDMRKNWVNPELTNQYRTFDQFNDNEEAKHNFDALIRHYVSWQHSTVYVRPNSMHFWDALKASDILYVVDQCAINKWLFKNLDRNFFDTLRLKEINENKDQFLTNILPVGQVGLIVMEHFIHFKPFDVIKQYLSESFELLKPGGHLLFTYNDCDLPSGARNFEAGQYCFTPGSMLERMCEATGFEITNSVSTDRVSWIALKKPGVLTSLKGGKTLGEIITP